LAGFTDALRAFFNPAPGFEPFEPIDEAYRIRSVTADDLWGAHADEWRSQSTTRERVDVQTALEVIAVQAAVRLLMNDIGSLPVDAYRSGEQGKKELRKPSWVVEPNPLNPNETWEDHVKATVFGVLSDGNAFTRCHGGVRNTEGLETIDPKRVGIEEFRGAPIYEVAGEGSFTPADIIHVPWVRLPGKARGLDPIAYAKQGLGIGIAADKFVGSYFGNGAILSGWIEFPPGADPTATQVADIKADFRRKHVGSQKSHAVGALTGGAKYNPFDYNNRDAQLLELRDSIIEDVARLYGIPPHMLGSQKPGAVGYASVEQRSIDYVTHAVLPIVKRIEVAYSRLLRGQQTYLKFNVNGLLRGDANARATFYTAMLNGKVLRREEARAFEDLPFDPEGVGYLETPNNNPPDDGPKGEPVPEE
jgi:HK97 family phage portal protein